MEVIERRKRLREKIIEDASVWARKLSLRVTAVLIGSYARGDFNLWSDVDVLLISDDFRGGPVERLNSLEIPPGFQVIPLTSKEFRRLLKRKDILALEAVESGIVLRDDLGIMS